MTRPGLHIDGATVSGTGTVQVLVDPATSEAIAEIAQASPTDVTRATQSAAAAFGEWAGRTPGERARVLLRLADLVEADAPGLTELEVSETGKPWAVVADGEIPFAADNLRFFAGSGRSLEGTGAGILSHGYTSLLIRRPIGVVVSIAPWNFPLVMAVWKLGPALAAGNTVVLKPAPGTPGTSLRLAELAVEAGLPAGVLNVVTGGTDVGEALVRRPARPDDLGHRFDPDRAAVMATASESAKRVHLELGGKAPAVVFEDADIDHRGRAVTLGATYNCGQDCTAATRVYVDRSRYAEVIDAMAAPGPQFGWARRGIRTPTSVP